MEGKQDNEVTEAQRLSYVVQRTNVREVLELLQVRKEIYCKAVEEVIKPSHKYISHTGKETECIVENFVFYVNKNKSTKNIINKQRCLTNNWRLSLKNENTTQFWHFYHYKKGG